MKQRPRILVAGSLVMDLIVSSSRFPQSGETVIGTGFQTASGGKGANQAVQASRLGAEVAMVGKVGRDDFGTALLRSVTEAGVDASRIMRSDTQPSAVGNVQLEVAGTKTANRIIVVPGANMDITPADVAFLENEIASYDMVILQLEIPMAVNEYIAAMAYRKGVPVMLNSAPSAPLSGELLRCLTYISPNEHEAADLTGVPVRDDASAAEAARVLRGKGVDSVLITLGGRGAAFDGGDGLIVSPCVDFGPVIDPTAAGDSFVGAFCTAECLGLPVRDVLAFANSTAGITVSRMGAQPSLPTIDEVLAFMRAQGLDTGALSVLSKR